MVGVGSDMSLGAIVASELLDVLKRLPSNFEKLFAFCFIDSIIFRIATSDSRIAFVVL